MGLTHGPVGARVELVDVLDVLVLLEDVLDVLVLDVLVTVTRGDVSAQSRWHGRPAGQSTRH